MIAKYQAACDANNGEITIDMVSDINNLMVRLLLACVVGKDVSENMIEYWVNGVPTKKDLGYALRKTFVEMIERLASPHVSLFPWLADVYLTQHERDLARNCQSIRNLVNSIIQQRKPTQNGDDNDLLSILLLNPLFADNDELMIDELLTIFFAGS